MYESDDEDMVLQEEESEMEERADLKMMTVEDEDGDDDSESIEEMGDLSEDEKEVNMVLRSQNIDSGLVKIQDRRGQWAV